MPHRGYCCFGSSCQAAAWDVWVWCDVTALETVRCDYAVLVGSAAGAWRHLVLCYYRTHACLVHMLGSASRRSTLRADRCALGGAAAVTVTVL